MVGNNPIFVLTRVTGLICCQETSMTCTQWRIRCQLIGILNDCTIRISWHKRRYRIRLQTMNCLLLIIITSILICRLIEVEIDRVRQAVRQLCIHFCSERHVLVIILINIKDTILVKETSAGKVVYLVITTIHRHIMLLLWSGLTIEIIIPIKVTIIVIFTIVTNYRPRSFWVFGLVISSIIKHLQIIICVI